MSKKEEIEEFNRQSKYRYDEFKKLEINFSWDNNGNYVLVTKEDYTTWFEYKIICSYDIKTGKILLSNDMIIIEKNMCVDNFINKKEIKKERNKKIEQEKLNRLIMKSYIEYEEEKIGVICYKNNTTIYYLLLVKVNKI